MSKKALGKGIDALFHDIDEKINLQSIVQIPINSDFSWGLGPGIQHSSNGHVLWQNGLTFGYKSLMAIYPKQGFGVVVLTNSDLGLTAAYDIVGRTLGGKAQWYFF